MSTISYENMTQEHLITLLQRTQRERDFYKNEYTYTWQLASNESLGPADKWCILLDRRVAQQAKKPLNEPQKMYYEKHAPMIGLSPEALGKHLKKLADSGIVERTVEVESDGKEIKKHVSIALTEAVVHHPDAVFLDAPRNKGYRQKNYVMCRNCGVELVNVKKLIQGLCPKCGEVHTYDPTKKEDKAFIVGEEIAENWQEMYGDVPLEEIEQLDVEVPGPTYPAPERDCLKCGTHCWEWEDNSGRWRSGCD